MSVFSQFLGGGGIKSVQRGATAPSSGSHTVTITSVNTSKTEVHWLGATSTRTSNNGIVQPRISLTNSTTLTISGGDSTNTVGWQVVEFN